MFIDCTVIRSFAFVLLVTVMVGCMQSASGYVQVLSVESLESAYTRITDIIEKNGFEKVECPEKNIGFLRACYFRHPPDYNGNDSEARRYFSVNVWGDWKNKDLTLFLNETYVDKLSLDGSKEFELFVKNIQEMFSNNRVIFGTDKKTAEALWKGLHRNQ